MVTRYARVGLRCIVCACSQVFFSPSMSDVVVLCLRELSRGVLSFPCAPSLRLTRRTFSPAYAPQRCLFVHSRSHPAVLSSVPTLRALGGLTLQVILDNMHRFLFAHCSAGHKGALREVLSNPVRRRLPVCCRQPCCNVCRVCTLPLYQPNPPPPPPV